jgi:hypothetical protein
MNTRLERRRATGWLFGVGFAVFASATATAAEDPAAHLPANTVGYIGWSEVMGMEDGKRLEGWVSTLVPLFADDPNEAAEGIAIANRVIRFGTTLLSGTGVFGIVDLRTAEQEIEPYFLTRVVLGGRATGAVKQLEELLDGAENVTVERVTVGGVSFQKARLEPDGPNVLWSAREGVFTALLGAESIMGVAESVSTIDAPLAESELLAACRKKVEETVPPTLSAFVNVKRLMSLIKGFVEQEEGTVPENFDAVTEELGVAQIEAMYLHYEQPDESTFFQRAMGQRAITRLFIKTTGDEKKGLLKLWDHAPLKDDDLALIPQDAYYGIAWNLDWAMLYGETERILTELSPEALGAMTAGMAMVEQFTNVSIPRDLLPALGDTWVFFDAPDHGGFLFTGMVAVVDVRDTKKLGQIFDRYIEVGSPFAQQVKVTLSPMKTRVGKHTIHYLVAAGVPFPFAPAAAFVGDRVVVGLSPQAVKVALEQVDPQQRESSVLDHPDYAKAKPYLAENMQSFAYADTTYGARGLYPLMLLVQTAAASITPDTELNPATIPTLPENLTSMIDGFGGWSTDNDGILLSMYGDTSVPASTPAFTVAWAATSTGVMLPSLFRARELAKRAVSRANLRGIGQACYIYANDHNEQFPESLDALLEAGILIGEKSLLSPRHDGRAYVYIAGQSPNDDIRNVLAYERFVGDEGTAVLYLDGHVEWLSEWEARDEIRATYERLGREVPEEFASPF